MLVGSNSCHKHACCCALRARTQQTRAERTAAVKGAAPTPAEVDVAASALFGKVVKGLANMADADPRMKIATTDGGDTVCGRVRACVHVSLCVRRRACNVS